MTIDLAELEAALASRPAVARVVVANTAGSTPREVGAAMLVWPDGQNGTIGGGELEYRAAETACAQLESGLPAKLSHVPLGPDLGQCCGGTVTLLTEVYTADDLTRLTGQILHVRHVSGPKDMPLSVKRLTANARNQGALSEATLMQGWMVEPVIRPTHPVWIYGAGHVGRALVQTLAPLPDLSVTWVDIGPERFPEDVPKHVRCLPAPDPVTAVHIAPDDARHLILTYSHALDLALCHAILSRGFTSTGLIGSATKWARFRRRLGALGHSPKDIDRIVCPIGDPRLGKHPQAIALGVATSLLKDMAQNEKNNRGKPIDIGCAPS